MKQLLTKIGIPMLALMALLAFVAPRTADAAVRFGVYLGGPVYPTYPYVYSYPYYDPYYGPYAYPYAHGYAYPYGYANPYYGGLYWGGGHRGHFERREFRGGERGFRGGERGFGGGERGFRGGERGGHHR